MDTGGGESADFAASSAAALLLAAAALVLSFSRQQCLYLRCDPQWQGSLRPGLALVGGVIGRSVPSLPFPMSDRPDSVVDAGIARFAHEIFGTNRGAEKRADRGRPHVGQESKSRPVRPQTTAAVRWPA